MNQNDKMAVISKVYKFEMISTIIFGLALISCHLELNKVKQSYFERQNGNNRTYANRLSIQSNLGVLVWLLAMGILYLSLALVYGSFTWYFCVPMMLLGLIAGVYLTQILTIQRQVRRYTNDANHNASNLVRFYTFISVLTVVVIKFFDYIILSKILTTALSGCIWFPQIIKNARN